MTTSQDDGRKKGLPVWLRAVLVLAAVGLVITAGSVFDFQSRLHSLLHHIESMGATGYGIFFAVYVAACVFLIPGSILTLGAGAIYGVVTGSILVSLSSTVGATAAFLVGRHLARDWVAGKIRGNDKFAAIDNAVGREGWKIVGLTRLSPVFPFALLNYAYGLTKVRLRDYILASWLGMLPGTVMYVYLGSLAKSLSAVGADCPDCERSALQWALYALGLVATVAVTVVVTRVARRALRQSLPTEDETKET
jgi:uncharacterized membrane protein YdjX (TVP38/TMEM64 family)